MKIGLVIKELMLKQNIEVADLAKRLGKTKQAVYDILDKEDVNTSLLRELAAIFNVPITIFFDNSVNNNQSNTGNNSIVLGQNNNVDSLNLDYKEKLESALVEIKHLKEVIDAKDKLLQEKERLINVLMNK
ncbi:MULTISPECIES: helix-turn-helix transcriptional regulator [Bacteroides]|uniref:helix-turn-helix transcriptional regulator n=1 Tax=Bacteroides TaxID=816 RepID=UPI00242A4BD0|nr:MULTISPECIES: helix-turn-helix transcriptional regulator [Bacteroides]